LRYKKAACVTQTAQQSRKRRAMMAGPSEFYEEPPAKPEFRTWCNCR
jgi:hypothetical protein